MKTKRVRGGVFPRLVECLNEVIPVYAVRWDVQPNSGMDGSAVSGYNWQEVQLWHKPSLGECKDIILAWFNEKIDYNILSGMVWNGMQIWLSTENQFNYKAAFDLATMTEGATLPVTFKFGTTENPIYYEFQTVEEITEFYTASMEYVTMCLKQGWQEKDTFDFTSYDPDYVSQEEEVPDGNIEEEE